MAEKMFLGNGYDLEKSEMGDQPVHYDPDDLTTHAVITGMTGSGKTGLGVIMLEEGALQGIPAIVVDPKGDLTNLLLHFPDLLPEDFQPWVDQGAARREGVSVEEAAQKAAALWKKGLASYGIEKPQLEALRDAVDFAVYTPGSDAGFPVSILASFSCPPIPWEGNKEILREKISSTVTAVLGLVGLKDIDPVRSKEHILLANIFEDAWRQGKDLDLAALISQVASPPFDKLGVFPLEQFYPEKERFELAMLLNNFLAAPAFHTWLEGHPLDIGKLLFTPSGKPRHSVFYLAHLNDAERMFFVTLLYAAIETWMRTQKGSGSLRAMVYFDEIAGYLPPVANPPSKNIILRMLKQARAFGVGLILSTQNPVDLDYKALSNAGTWMVGRLQTDQDKARLLDGLEGASPGLDRKKFDRMISLLDKRVFLLHNVHEDAAEVFHTRWAMNYLPGPLTRAQIPAVNALVDAKIHGQQKVRLGMADVPEEGQSTDTPGRSVAPAIPGSIPVQYLPADRGLSDAMDEVQKRYSGELGQPSTLYRPILAAQARVAFLDRSTNISHETVITVRMDELNRRGLIQWEGYLAKPLEIQALSSSPMSNASFDSMDSLSALDAKYLKSLQTEFEDWIYRTQAMTLRVNETLGVVAGPDVSKEEFKKMNEEAIEKKKQEELEVLKIKYEKKLDALEEKLKKEEFELAEDKQELSHRRMEEAGKGLENIIGMLGGRSRSLTTSLTKRRMTAKAKADVEESEEMIAAIQEEIKGLEAEMAKDFKAVEERVADAVDQVVEKRVSPYKKDIFTELFDLVWIPNYAFKTERDWLTVTASQWDADQTSG
jgi:hypothetical protein